MKKLKNILALFLFVSLLGACSDDENVTNPTNDGLSFPMAQGNTWTYDVYELDENENMTDVKLGTNKLIIGEAVTIDGRSGFYYTEETTISSEGEDEPNATAMSSDENGLYIYFSSFTDDEENPLIGITPGWTKVIDFKNQTWESLNIPIDISDEGTTTKGSIKMTGSKVGAVNVTYKGKSYTAQRYKSTFAMNITITSPFGSFSIDGEDDSYYVIISGIGMFEVKSIEIDEETEMKGGEVEILVDHTLN
jgi:hypothetical protein